MGQGDQQSPLFNKIPVWLWQYNILGYPFNLCISVYFPAEWVVCLLSSQLRYVTLNLHIYIFKKCQNIYT